ncbi:hypothetical protein LTR56_012722 [Elasticomyces elasticus]|nr:hypothetical protein LTR22_022993 [Elasticomyces elasticus]KAK3638999.1 hypothetical protein LTR56_012722 [Elasticomyces elasticus]KAK4918747.1 hypothetical protein LTR49_013534 [Elasticomyces elasticus]KAK5754424.1 hypothetical protein LTS12_015493 [Elasticomyces elasticus]
MPLRTTSDRTTRSMTARNLAVSGSRRANNSNSIVEGSRLLNLPPELRNRIYEYTLSHGVVVVCRKRANNALSGLAVGIDASHRRNCLALLRTNKQIYNESASLFYFCNHFEVQAWRYTCDGDNPLDVEDEHPRSTMSALHELLQKIGVTGGNAPIHITFALGSMVNTYVVLDWTSNIMQRLLEDLRTIQATDTRIRLDVTMEAYIEHNPGGHQGLSPIDNEYHPVRLGMPDPLPDISAFIAQLSNMFAQNSTIQVHDDEDLQDFDGFFRRLRQSIEESPKWQQAPEAICEGDGQEKAGEDERG